jgi:uncharacterized protein (DUF488 family)
MTIYTIGFTRKSAEMFFAALRAAGVRSLIDVRLNNTSQLAGFTRRDDLAYFSQAILGVPYQHLTALAPTREMLDTYRSGGTWEDYERGFTALLRDRRVEDLRPDIFDAACLLCSEVEPDRCHRRVAAQYLQRAWPGVTIVHL